MSDQVLLAIVGGLVVIVGGAITTVGSVVIARMNSAAKKVETVASDLAVSDALKGKQLSKIEDTTDKTLVHVNDQFLIQLRANRDMARVIAELRKTPEDVKKANEAEALYREHESKQAEMRGDKMTVELAKAAAVVIKEGVSSGVVTSVTAATKVDSGQNPIA